MGHGHVIPNPDGSKARCGGPGICPECNQEAVSETFRGAAGEVRVPVEDQAVIDGAPLEVSEVAHSIGYALAERGVKFTADDAIAAAYRVVEQQSDAVRVTEATATKTDTKKKPYGDVEYADPGWQKDGKKRYPLDTEEHVRAAWSYINQTKNQKPYSADQLSKIKAKIRAAAKKLGIQIAEQASEAMINGQMSFSDIIGEVSEAIRKRVVAATGQAYAYVYVADLTATDVVYCHGDDLFQCSYEIDQAGAVTLGEPVEVVRTYAPAPPDDPDGDDDDLMKGTFTATDDEGDDDAEGAVEARGRIAGRVIEALGTDGDGGRVFRVQIIEYGDSKNRRRYPEAVMREAASLYEGAKAYDHHRTDEELKTSTIKGLVGFYRNVEAADQGLEADLHLLPGATHAAEALDATIANQEAGLPPVIGLSHDVMARFRNVVEGGMQVQEATAITQVNSADLVADPAAGGRATRMVAGGIEGTGTVPADNKEDAVAPTVAEILGALKEATPEQLAAAGLTRAPEATTEEQPNDQPAERETEAAGVLKGSFMGGLMIKAKVEDAGLPIAVVEGVRDALPDRITESDVDAQIAALKNSMGLMERAQLMPSVASTKVTQESLDKKIKALDAFFGGRYSEGYRSFKQAWEDFTGHRPRAWDADINKQILRESMGFYDSGDRMRVEEGTARLREGMDSTSWNFVLGDSITRRMIAEYSRPDLGLWRQVVSSIVPLNDFRTQRIERLGGYGTLPTVNQGAPYQDLTSPGNEEATYAPSKRGGIESITFEMIANDDVRAISKIPFKLGLAAAQTLYRFIFDLFVTNPATTYDGVTLFHASHGNTNTNALSGSALSAVRAAMRQQTAAMDSKDILSIVPQTLIVPSALEELAWQLATSIVALPSGAPTGAASDIPNIHSRMNQPIVVDYYTDQNDWYTVADPAKVPTIEVGFYAGRQDPEIFTQNDPNVGSVFDADKITYKIRHIYGSTVLDHRGFYRNTL